MGMWTEWRGPRSEWSRQTRITAFIAGAAVAMVSVVAIGYVQDRASGATPADARQTTSGMAPGAAPASARRCVPPGGGDQTCERWAKRQVKKFKDGRTG